MFAAMPAAAQVNVALDAPGVSIGINIGTYPQLVAIPGYPVYYAPNLSANYFFYDGMFWTFVNDTWYTSAWYDGPWQLVDPVAVPLYVLRVPVRYYRVPPPYFRGWVASAPPHWGDHWGHSWEERRVGWDRWDRSAVPPPAPLPTYQRQYSGNRYPRIEQQQALQNQNYRYRPQDAVAQQYYGRAERSGATNRGQATAAAPHPQAAQPGNPPPQAQRGRGQESQTPAREQQQAQQRQAEQAQHSQQQAQQRQAEQAQRSQQQAQQHQAEQAHRSQQQAQQRPAQQQEHEQRAPQGKPEESKERQGG